jgi:hypothetical protein
MKKLIEKVGDAELVFTETESGSDMFTMSSPDAALQRWIDTRRTQRLRSDKIRYAVDAAMSFAETGVAEGRGRRLSEEVRNSNPVVELHEKCQAEWRRPFVAKVVGVYGEAHCPTIKVRIELPDGKSFTEIGSSKKHAMQDAAREALSYLNYAYDI